jgi:hypothetical protein
VSLTTLKYGPLCWFSEIKPVPLPPCRHQAIEGIAPTHACFLKNDYRQPFIQNDKDSQSKAAVSCKTTRVRTPQQLQQGRWRKHVETLCCALSTLPLAPGDVHLFSPLKEALGESRFIADDEVKHLVQRWLD